MGLEVIVRPVVFPNIRPGAPRVLMPLDDPTKGVAVISGGGGQFVGTSRNWSVNVSKQLPQQETKRQFNKERVYQTDANGQINKNNFIDVERLKKVRTDDSSALTSVIYADPPKRDNVEVLESDAERLAEGTAPL